MARRLLIAALVTPLLAFSTLQEVARAPAFTIEDADGVSFDGAVRLNQYLLDEEMPPSVRVSGGAEPVMLVSKSGSMLWIGDTSGLYRSTNGGATWTRSPNPFLPSVVTDGWALAEDDAGRLYVSTTIGPTSSVVTSTNGGASWSTASHVTGVDTISDRPWLAARGAGEVILVVNGDRGEECYRSTDGGLTYRSLSTVNNGVANAGNLVFDSKGGVWFHNQRELWVWRTPCGVTPTNINTDDGGPALFTQVDVDEADRIYWAQASTDSTKIILSGRLNTGTAAPRTLVVSAPELKSNTFPTLSVLDSGEIAVGWYGSETPGDPSTPAFDGAWNVYAAKVTGFWTATPTITPYRITAEPNHVGDFCMGGVSCDLGTTPGDRDLLDYFMIDYGETGVLHVAYGHDGTTSHPEVRYAQLDP